MPVIDSPVLVTVTTLPASTWSRKALYEIVTVGGWLAEKARLLITTLAMNRIARITQKRTVRIGARRSGFLSGGLVGVRAAGGPGGRCAIN